MLKLTSSTALIWSTVRRNTPFFTGNQTLTCCACTNGGSSACSTVPSATLALERTGLTKFSGTEANNFRVYACCGAVNTCEACPTSTNFPYCMTPTCCAICATTPKSCVINKILMPVSACKWRSNLRISA